MPRKNRKKTSKCAVLLCCTVDTADSDDDVQCNKESTTSEVIPPSPQQQSERTVASITKDIMERNKHLFEYPNQNQRAKWDSPAKDRKDDLKRLAEPERPPRRKKKNSSAKTKISVEDSRMTIIKTVKQGPEATRQEWVDHSDDIVLEDPVAVDTSTKNHQNHLKGKRVKDNICKEEYDVHQICSSVKNQCRIKTGLSISTSNDKFPPFSTDEASISTNLDVLKSHPHINNDKIAGKKPRPSRKVLGCLHQKEIAAPSCESLKDDTDEKYNAEDRTILCDTDKEKDSAGVNENRNLKDITISSSKGIDVEQADKSVKQHVSESSPKSSNECTARAASLDPTYGFLDDSSSDSSSGDRSKANKILEACTQGTVQSTVPKVPVPPKQPLMSDRRTMRRASKPRVRTQEKEKTAGDTITKDTDRSSSSPAVRSSELRQELRLSPEIGSYKSGHSESTDSLVSHQHSRASKSDGSTKERRTPPSDMSPSDLREEMTNSPGSELSYESSACDSAHQDELPILPETNNKTKTSEERFSSIPKPFGNNPVLETKLPNRLGSSAVVLGAIGGQNTPEKDPIQSQYCPAPRRLDFSKHLLLTTRQDRETAVESSSEESLQEKGLDDLLKPESKDILMNKKFSRLSQSAFPPSPTAKTVETKPAWSFYEKDFTSRTLTSGFRKGVRAKQAAAAPRTRDLPPPQPKDNLLAPSLFGRRPGKDLPPVLGRVPSPGQPPKHSSKQVLSSVQPRHSTSPTFHQPMHSTSPALYQPFINNQMHNPQYHHECHPSPELAPRYSQQQKLPTFQPIHSNTPDFHPSLQPFHGHKMQDHLAYPSHITDTGPSSIHPSSQPFSLRYGTFPLNRQGPHLSDSSGFIVGNDDGRLSRHRFQNPNTVFYQSGPKGLLEKEKSRRYH